MDRGSVITTIINMRAPGMTLHKMPLFVWAMLMQSVIIILCIPVLAGAVSASSKFGSLLEQLSMETGVNQQVLLLSGSIIGVAGLYFNDNTPKGVKGSFPSYLAGLIEGDGAISLPKIVRNKNGKLNYPSITIAFALKDLPLANFL